MKDEKYFNPDKYGNLLTGEPKSCNRVQTSQKPIVEPLRFVRA